MIPSDVAPDKVFFIVADIVAKPGVFGLGWLHWLRHSVHRRYAHHRGRRLRK